MKEKQPVTYIIRLIPLVLLLAVVVVGCQTVDSDDVTSTEPTPAVVPEETTATTPATTDASYPSRSPTDSAYPGETEPESRMPEGAFAELPDPERNIPSPGSDSGSIGGFLVRIEGEGYMPVTPQNLYLGRVLLDDQGRQSVISRSSQSHRAELLPTGVFIFNNVEPGTYGLIVDIAVIEFPVLDENQQPLLLEVQAGQAIDLGAVLVEMP
jgi:hypothetical protein